MNFLLIKSSFSDASSSNEAVHLQQRLRSLSTELVTLRNRLHVQGTPAPIKNAGTAVPCPTPAPTPQPVVPPKVAPCAVTAATLKTESKTSSTTAVTPSGGANLEDLIHLEGPLTEDAVMKCLQTRFRASNFYVSLRTSQKIMKIIY